MGVSGACTHLGRPACPAAPLGGSGPCAVETEASANRLTLTCALLRPMDSIRTALVCCGPLTSRGCPAGVSALAALCRHGARTSGARHDT